MPEYCMLSPHAPPVADKTTIDTASGSATQALYRAAVGSLNTDYYLPIFSGFETTEKLAFRWNTAAGLYTLNWMVFRRLWGAALTYASTLAGGTLLFFGLSRLVFHLSAEIELALAIAMLSISVVVPGFFGNAWLHAHCRQRMAQALSHTTSLQQACDHLLIQSSSKKRFLGIILINVMAMIMVAVPLLIRPEGAATIKPPTLPALDSAPVTQTPHLPGASPVLPAVLNSEPVQALDPAPTPLLPQPQSPPLPPPPPLLALPEATPLQTHPPSATSYYINVGLFANMDNAERAHQRLKAAGLSVTTETLNMSKGRRSRVRVGPFPTRSEADEAARSIRKLELDAVVGKI
jgi:cell division septation protein DedD